MSGGGSSRAGGSRPLCGVGTQRGGFSPSPSAPVSWSVPSPHVPARCSVSHGAVSGTVIRVRGSGAAAGGPRPSPPARERLSEGEEPQKKGSQTFCPFPAPFPTLNVSENFTKRAERIGMGCPGRCCSPQPCRALKDVRLKIWTGGSWRSPPTPTILGLCELIPHPTPQQPRGEPQHAALHPRPSLGSPPRPPKCRPQLGGRQLTCLRVISGSHSVHSTTCDCSTRWLLLIWLRSRL